MVNNDIKIIMKTLDTQGNLIKAQQEVIEDMDATIDTLKDEKSLVNEYDKKEYMLFLYLKSNAMIKDLIENMPSNITPNQITLKNLKVSVKPKSTYGEIYKDSMGISRDELSERSKSLKQKDKEFKHFTRIHKEMYVE